LIALENWRKDPSRVPWYAPSWGALIAAMILDGQEAPHEHHEHLHIVRL
jgi:hypothetical protein